MKTGEQLPRDARAAGIPQAEEVDLGAVERRRRQLWTVTTALLVFASGIIGAVALSPAFARYVVDGRHATLVAFPVIGLGFAVYSFEKERALQRVTQGVLADHVGQVRLTLQARRLRAALQAGTRIHASLGLDEVIDGTLDGALQLSGADDATVHLLEDGTMRVAATRGPDLGAHVDADTVEAMAALPVPRLLRDEHDRSLGLVVPLGTGSAKVIGVLTVGPCPSGDHSEDDLAALHCFAEFAAVAIENARRFEEERSQAERLMAMESAREEFTWLGRDADDLHGIA